MCHPPHQITFLALLVPNLSQLRNEYHYMNSDLPGMSWLSFSKMAQVGDKNFFPKPDKYHFFILHISLTFDIKKKHTLGKNI